MHITARAQRSREAAGVLPWAGGSEQLGWQGRSSVQGQSPQSRYVQQQRGSLRFRSRLCAGPPPAQPRGSAAARQDGLSGQKQVRSWHLPGSCAKPAWVICLSLNCAFACLVYLGFFFSRKCSVYFSQCLQKLLYLTSPSIAGKNCNVPPPLFFFA